MRYFYIKSIIEVFLFNVFR